MRNLKTVFCLVLVLLMGVVCAEPIHQFQISPYLSDKEDLKTDFKNTTLQSRRTKNLINADPPFEQANFIVASREDNYAPAREILKKANELAGSIDKKLDVGIPYVLEQTFAFLLENTYQHGYSKKLGLKPWIRLFITEDKKRLNFEILERGDTEFHPELLNIDFTWENFPWVHQAPAEFRGRYSDKGQALAAIILDTQSLTSGPEKMYLRFRFNETNQFLPDTPARQLEQIVLFSIPLKDVEKSAEEKKKSKELEIRMRQEIRQATVIALLQSA